MSAEIWWRLTKPVPRPVPASGPRADPDRDRAVHDPPTSPRIPVDPGCWAAHRPTRRPAGAGVAPVSNALRSWARLNDDVGCEQVRHSPRTAIGIADGRNATPPRATPPAPNAVGSERPQRRDLLHRLRPSRPSASPPGPWPGCTVFRRPLAAGDPPRARGVPPGGADGPGRAAAVAAALALERACLPGPRRPAPATATGWRWPTGHGRLAAPPGSPPGSLGSASGRQAGPRLVRHLDQPAGTPEHYDVQRSPATAGTCPSAATVSAGIHRTWGAQIPVELTQVRQLRFEAASGQFTMTAYLSPRNPWSPG